MMRHILFLTIFLGICLPVSADRGFLQAPDLVTFDKTQYFAKEYISNLEECRQKFQAYNATNILAQLDQLTNLFNKSEVLAAVADVKAAKEAHENLDLREDTDITDSLKKLEDFVKYNAFYKALLIDFEIDAVNREYIVSWNDENGILVTKYVPFVPEMSVKIKAEIATENINGIATNIYQYYIQNYSESAGDVEQLSLESKFSNTSFRRSMKIKIISEGSKHAVFFPGGYTPFFRFNLFENQRVAGLSPGELMAAPFSLETIPNTNVGVLNSYISVYGYDPASNVFDYEVDANSAIDIFATKTGSYTKHLYKGTTIGPVPVPTDYNKADFIQTIIGYNQQAIDEGWVEDAAVATYTTDTLQAIAADPDNTAQINTFLSQIEGHYTDGKLLSEAYALLKYNLEYLLSH